MSAPVQDPSTPDTQKHTAVADQSTKLNGVPKDEAPSETLPEAPSETLPEAPSEASNEAATKEHAKLKVQARGMSVRSSMRELIEAANEAGISARFYKGLSVRHGRRDVYITAKSEPAMNEAKEFFQKWVNEQPEPQRKPKASSQEADSGQEGGSPQEAGADKPVEETPEKAEPTEVRTRQITYVDVSDDNRRPKPKKHAKRVAGAKPEGEATAESSDLPKPESAETEGGQSAARKSRNKSRKSAKVAAASATTTDGATAEAKPDATVETGNLAKSESTEPEGGRSAARSRRNKSKGLKKPEITTTTPEGAEENGAAAETAEAAEGTETAPRKTKEKRQRKRAAQLKVSQTDTVYVKLPLETTMEELRALLPDFPSVEISMGTLPQRTRRINGRKVELPEVATATITVGGEHQQKAIEILKTKEVRGQQLNPKPAFRRVLAKEHELQHAEATPDVDELPQSEHVESKE